MGTFTATNIEASTYAAQSHHTPVLDVLQIPPRRQSLLPSAFESGSDLNRPFLAPDGMYSGDWSNSVHWNSSVDTRMLEPECIPPPLSISPRIPSSPDHSRSRSPAPSNSEAHATVDASKTQEPRDSRHTSTESTSWLDTIDESGGSSSSSLHSRHSSFGIYRKPVNIPTGDTEAELSAAMDAAVEAAYDDNFDLAENKIAEDDSGGDMVSKNRRNVAQARQILREAEQEDLVQEQKRVERGKVNRKRDNSIDLDYLDAEAEEEEQLLEEMTKGFVMDDFQFGIQSTSAPPHQSDSSVFSGRTWASSNSSQTAATASSITGLGEGAQVPTYQKVPPPHPPPAGALPVPPACVAAPPVPPAPSLPPPRPPSFGVSPPPGVRDRRLSGQNAKQLKIETHSRMSSGSPAKKDSTISTHIAPVEEDSAVPAGSSELRSSKPLPSPRPPVPQAVQPLPMTPLTSIHSGSSVHSESPATPALTRTATQDGDEPAPASPARFMVRSTLPSGLLRKNLSSSSLKMRNLAVSTTEVLEVSPVTPGSATFSIHTDPRKGIMASTPVMPTPTGNTFPVNGLPAGAMYLFDDQICSPTTPLSPGSSISDAPLPLEACPESFLLRPFWLMRCLYQTIAHPRGGYLSTKLFVPRDVWRVKNVKIKGIEDKVGQCDFLTAALRKLSKVDTLDADAVLEEMQSFETILEQVRNVLQKKLGSEVGVQSSAALFKASPITEDGAAQADTLSTKPGNASSKSYLSSWRKLRSKSSGAGLVSSYTAAPSKDGNKEILSISSVPMTSTPTSRTHKRDVSQIQLTGPNAHYMLALAQLFDAVQILGKYSRSLIISYHRLGLTWVTDQIARQVEDPGLKHSSKTHVGLELSARNAAEFFGFYVCRFALNDVSLMLDKFIKRGSEWVLA
jgi:hypothetical protein